MGVHLDQIADEKLRRKIREADAQQNHKQTQGEPVLEKRIRQSSKPVLNKLEQEWFDILESSHWMDNLRAQSKRYKLGNGIWYKPDMTGNDTRDGRETAYEVKGPFAFRGGFENLKVAASAWPEINWILVWKDNGEWKQQKILP